MKVTVTTRHLTDNLNPEKLKAYALKKSKRIEKYLKVRRRVDGEVRPLDRKVQGQRRNHINSKVLKTASTFETTDMLAAIDGAVDNIIAKLKKETDKMITAKRRVSPRTLGETLPAAESPERSPADISAVKVRKLSRKL